MKIFAKSIIRNLCRIINHLGLMPKTIVIHSDGGICSQMHFYLIGEILRDRGHDVKFDYEWFKSWGKDINGQFCRNLDIGKLFPYLNLRVCNQLVAKLYRTFFLYSNNYFEDNGENLKWIEFNGPCYMDGYYHDPEEMYTKYFRDVFKIDEDVLDDKNKNLLTTIKRSNGEVCAIHVRRGDLSNYLESYGNPASIEYFIKSINLIASMNPEVKFFMFSDEPDWCKGMLLPELSDYNIKLCPDNGSDKGYCDLILMSRCKYIITSQGSLGKYAAMLRPEAIRSGLVTLIDNQSSKEWISRFDNCIII